MPADQAAGLRRRSAQQPLRCIHCFLASAESTALAHALHQRGWTSLLVNAGGRVFAGSPTRSLFDWRQQVARGHLQTFPMPYGDALHAPGMLADEPTLLGLAAGYDAVVFDAGLDGAGLVLMPGALHDVVIEVHATHEAMQRGYALLKTLFHAGEALSVGLLGDPAACEQLWAACAQFLGQTFAQAICNVAHQVDAFAALAVRMVHEETGLTARYIIGST